MLALREVVRLGLSCVGLVSSCRHIHGTWIDAHLLASDIASLSAQTYEYDTFPLSGAGLAGLYRSYDTTRQDSALTARRESVEKFSLAARKFGIYHGRTKSDPRHSNRFHKCFGAPQQVFRATKAELLKQVKLGSAKRLDFYKN